MEDPLIQGQSSVKQKVYLVRGKIPRLKAWGGVKNESDRRTCLSPATSRCTNTQRITLRIFFLTLYLQHNACILTHHLHGVDLFFYLLAGQNARPDAKLLWNDLHVTGLPNKDRQDLKRIIHENLHCSLFV